jgi:hypothetical protein
MAVNDFTGKNIQDTYQRVVQTDGTNLADGTGSLLPISFNGNNVIIEGNLTAQTYVVSQSIVNVSSGSTIFGNSLDDIHVFTGSLSINSVISEETTGSVYIGKGIFGGDEVIPANVIQVSSSNFSAPTGRVMPALYLPDWSSAPNYGDTNFQFYSELTMGPDGGSGGEFVDEDGSSIATGSVGILRRTPFDGNQLLLGQQVVIQTNTNTTDYDEHRYEGINSSLSIGNQASSWTNGRFRALVGSISGTLNTNVDPSNTGMYTSLYLSDNTGGTYGGGVGNTYILYGTAVSSTAKSYLKSSLELVGNLTASGDISASGNTSTITASTGSYHILKGDTTKATGLFVNGTITSSGDISSSGNILAGIYKSHGTIAIAFSSDNIKISEDYPIILNHSSTTATNITASGNISSSGYVYGDRGVFAERLQTPAWRFTDIEITSDNGPINFTGPSGTNIAMNTAGGHITASGNISSSGDIQFNTLTGTINGGTF